MARPKVTVRGRGRGWHGNKPGHRQAALKGKYSVSVRELPVPNAGMVWSFTTKKLSRPRPYGAAIGEARGGPKYTHGYKVWATGDNGKVLIADGVATSLESAKFRADRSMKRAKADPLSVARAKRSVVK